jgi:hypothetical protein
MRRCPLIFALLCLAAATAAPLRAQTSEHGAPFRSLMVPGSMADEAQRTEQLLGRASADGYLLRSTGTLDRDTLPAPAVTLLAPSVLSVWNSALPYSPNTGTLWAGRGASALVTAGVRARIGPLSLTVAPELSYQANRDFQTRVYPIDAPAPRDPFASPWYPPPHSADVPLRFGSDAETRISLGQSRLELAAGPLALGAATESQWWGPGLRNALVLSSNAPGFPHAFAETRRPLRSRLGSLEAKWILGRLTESGYFDADPTNDHRGLSAGVIGLRPAFEPNLTLGAARAVYSNVSGTGAVAGRALDLFRDVGQPTALQLEDTEGAGDHDQVFSLFARWLLPRSGFEAYAEWARAEQPESLRDLLVSPNHSQGYTVGLQWADEIGRGGVLRLQAEASYLEQSATYRVRPTPTFYTSRAVPQGYTHEGRVLGAAIGPAGSSQWIAADYMAARWQLGVLATRIRWNNDALYRFAPAPTYASHDVTFGGGLRGSLRLGRLQASAELLEATRYSYLFQYYQDDDGRLVKVDVPNRTARLEMRFVPRR